MEVATVRGFSRREEEEAEVPREEERVIITRPEVKDAVVADRWGQSVPRDWLSRAVNNGSRLRDFRSRSQSRAATQDRRFRNNNYTVGPFHPAVTESVRWQERKRNFIYRSLALEAPQTICFRSRGSQS